jgi:hypothetical protein
VIPASIAFCHSSDFSYVSCSPFRVPIARLAAAQAAIRTEIISNIVVCPDHPTAGPLNNERPCCL